MTERINLGKSAPNLYQAVAALDRFASEAAAAVSSGSKANPSTATNSRPSSQAPRPANSHPTRRATWRSWWWWSSPPSPSRGHRMEMLCTLRSTNEAQRKALLQAPAKLEAFLDDE